MDPHPLEYLAVGSWILLPQSPSIATKFSFFSIYTSATSLITSLHRAYSKLCGRRIIPASCWGFPKGSFQWQFPTISPQNCTHQPYIHTNKTSCQHLKFKTLNNYLIKRILKLAAWHTSHLKAHCEELPEPSIEAAKQKMRWFLLMKRKTAYWKALKKQRLWVPVDTVPLPVFVVRYVSCLTLDNPKSPTC